jgi:PII-like signaling protein
LELQIAGLSHDDRCFLKHDCLRLTVWFGESERVGGRLLSGSLLDRCEAAAVEGVLLLRGSSEFGIKHGLQTEDLLTLSRNLPQVLVAVDRSERIEQIAATVEAGLVTSAEFAGSMWMTMSASSRVMPG